MGRICRARKKIYSKNITGGKKVWRREEKHEAVVKGELRRYLELYEEKCEEKKISRN